MDLNDFYRAYGESLASRLMAIGHGDATPAFIFVEDMGDPAEVLDFTSRGKAEKGQNVLVWEQFMEDIDTAGRDNYHSVLKGSLAVIGKATDRAEIRQTFSRTRTTVLKLLALMLEDEAGGELGEWGIVVGVRELACEKVSVVANNWYGYGLQFTWTVPLDLTLSDADRVTLTG